LIQPKLVPYFNRDKFGGYGSIFIHPQSSQPLVNSPKNLQETYRIP